MSEANRTKAGEIVAKMGRYYPNPTSPERRYCVWVGGKHFYAGDTAILADKVAEYLDSLEKWEETP